MKTPSGEVLLVDAALDDTVEDIVHYADQYLRCPIEVRDDVFQGSVMDVDKLIARNRCRPGKYVACGIVRDYFAPLSNKEKEDIAYIVNTLSDQPTPKLLFYKTSLTQAGDRVNHVHPLNFVGTIFSDELLKVKVRNIKRKGWVWKDFIAGIRNTMNEERAKNNLHREYFEDFVSKVGIEYRKLESSIDKGNWDEFVNVLIKHAQSQGDNDRYNM